LSNGYLQSLKDELDSHPGVYVFYDSRGRAIYIGKTRKSLWKEMTNAFNRDRGGVQNIKLVNHPLRNQPYNNSEEIARQIVDRDVPLSWLASYFSAYEVQDWMVNDLEAILVRVFANDLLNKNMKKFHQQRTRAAQ